MAGVKGKSGRKTKAEEIGLSMMLTDCWSDAERRKVIRNLHKFAVSEDAKAAIGAAGLLLAYAYGKPTERLEHSFDLSQLTDDELKALEPVVAKLTQR